jgi:hypothetical protein
VSARSDPTKRRDCKEHGESSPCFSGTVRPTPATLASLESGRPTSSASPRNPRNDQETTKKCGTGHNDRWTGLPRTRRQSDRCLTFSSGRSSPRYCYSRSAMVKAAACPGDPRRHRSLGIGHGFGSPPNLPVCHFFPLTTYPSTYDGETELSVRFQCGT